MPSGRTALKAASLWAEIVSLLGLVDLAIICSPESESRRDCLDEQTPCYKSVLYSLLNELDKSVQKHLLENHRTDGDAQ